MRTIEPDWYEHFALPCDDASDSLIVTIEDYDMLSANDFMGTFTIPVERLKDREFSRDAFPLFDRKGLPKKKGTWGLMDLALRWVHDPKYAFPIPERLAEDESKESAAKPPNCLRIFLIRGRGLPVADKNLFSKGGSSDPMLTFRMGTQEVESSVQKKSLAPIWTEGFELRADDADDAIHCAVDDWDLLSGNDFMGQFWIEVGDFKSRELDRRWYACAGEKAKRETPPDPAHPLGKIEVACRWIFLEKFNLPVPPRMSGDDDFPGEATNGLHVFLVRGARLPIMDKNLIGGGGSSDPLVTITLDGERRNSKVKKKNLGPIWNEYFEFPVEDTSDVLRVVCDDWDLTSGNDFMGAVDVPLRMLTDRTLFRQWWWLRDENGRDLKASGKLELAFRLFHNPAWVFATPPAFEARDAKDRPPNVFQVHIVRAKGLPIMDPNMMSKGGSSDPLCQLAMSGDRRKSAIKKQSLAPIWEESFFFAAEDADEVLEFEVLDYDVMSADDFMGRLTIPLKHHGQRSLVRGWFALEGKKGDEVGKDRGRVELCLRWCFDIAYYHALPPHMEEDEDPEMRRKAANCVVVFLIRAKNLPIMDKNVLTSGGSSDPLATLVLEGEQARSSVQKKTLCPVWCECFEFAAHDAEDVLEVAVDDWDALSGNDFIGKIRIPVEALEHRETVRAWHDLEDDEGKRVQGKIEVACRRRYSPAYDIKLPKAFTESDKHPYDRPNVLMVFLIRARGLPALDFHPLCLPTSDPTVKFGIHDQPALESSTKWKTLTPEWCEVLTFDLEDLANPLKIEAFDKDVGVFDSGDDVMGDVEVDLRPLRDRKVLRKWFRLRGDEATTHRSAYGGKVEVALRWVHDPSLVEALPWEFLHPDAKLLKLDFNAVKVLVLRARTHADAPNDLEAAVRLNMPRVGKVAAGDERASKVEGRPPGTKFTRWFAEFLIPLDEEMKARDSLVCVIRCGAGKELGKIVGTVSIEWREVKCRAANRSWHLLHGHAKSPEPQEVELAVFVVHDRKLEHDREFRRHAREMKKRADEQRGYSLDDLVNLIPVGDGQDRFILRIKPEPGVPYQLKDSYCCMAKRILLKDARGEWAVVDVPSPFDFRRTFPKNLRDFIQLCFDSGYQLEGDKGAEQVLSAAIWHKRDINLYLDAPGDLFDYFEEQLFDFCAR